MTTATLKSEVKIMMQFFKIPVSKFEEMIKIHGGIDKYHAHLGKMFDNRKENRN